MKCKHCGAELKQLFYMNSWYCPNDCDRKLGVSEETLIAVSKKIEFKKGDKVRICQLTFGKNRGWYEIDEIYYFTGVFRISEKFGQLVRASRTKEDALNNNSTWNIALDELELVE